jgi:predicted Zn-dependent protease
MVMLQKNLRIFSLIILLVFWIASCAINPVTGQRELMLLDEQEEIELGRQVNIQVVQEFGIYDDPELSTYVNDFCQKLAKISHRPNLPYDCKVMDSPVVNAFAVPGGYIYFTRGILAYLNNEAEMIGVMGHELGHVTARHSAQQYSRAQLAQVGLGVGMIFLDYLPAIAGEVAQLGVQMLFLKFSRDNERQSDDLGVEYASRLGYDAEQMANFFNSLDRMRPSSDRSPLPDWFSTHPNPAERNETVSLKAKQWQEKLGLRSPKINRDEYLRRIEGLVFGENPRQGFVENNIFYHPDLRFEFPVPQGWILQNTPAFIRLVSPNKDAMIIFTISPEGPPKQAALQFTQKNKAEVIESSPTEVNGLPAHRLISEVRSSQGVLTIKSYFIEKEGKVYMFHGFTSPVRFDQYSPTFSITMEKFRELTDPKKLAVKPPRVRIRSAPQGGSVRGVLVALGVPEDDLERTALLNGKTLNENIGAGTMMKVIER